MKIGDIIKAIVKPMIKPSLFRGKVVKFHKDWWIDVELNMGGKAEMVKIRSVLNGNTSGLFIEPEINSSVIIGMADGILEDMTLVCASEIKAVKIIPSGELILRGDEYGGLVKISDLNDNLTAIKQHLNNLQAAITSGISAVGAGPAANGATGATAFTNAMAGKVLDFKNMENKEVKHG